jgi:SH3-like domain-containing protein
MQSKKQAFADLTKQLHAALAADNWEAIASLDGACSALVATLEDEDATDVELRAEIDAMAEVYAKLQLAGRSERERLVLELTKLNQAPHINQAYKPLD